MFSTLDLHSAMETKGWRILECRGGGGGFRLTICRADRPSHIQYLYQDNLLKQFGSSFDDRLEGFAKLLRRADRSSPDGTLASGDIATLLANGMEPAAISQVASADHPVIELLRLVQEDQRRFELSTDTTIKTRSERLRHDRPDEASSLFRVGSIGHSR